MLPYAIVYTDHSDLIPTFLSNLIRMKGVMYMEVPSIYILWLNMIIW